MLTRVGPLIELTEQKEIFQRIVIACNREMEWPEDNRFLLKSIMTNTKDRKWSYPRYNVNRISLTWPTRNDFLEYVNYLKEERDIQILMQEEKVEEATNRFLECKEVLISPYRPTLTIADVARNHQKRETKISKRRSWSFDRNPFSYRVYSWMGIDPHHELWPKALTPTRHVV